MARQSGTRSRWLIALTAAAALLAAACGDDGEQSIANSNSQPVSGDDGTPDDSDSEDGEAEDGESDEPQRDLDEIAEACEEGPGKTVTMLDDVVIPAFSALEFSVEDEVVAGETVPGFTIPAIEIPEHTIEAGCIVEHEAPGACLGAVEISAVTDIPPVEIAGYEVPAAVTSNGETLYAGEEVAGDRAEGQSIVGDSVAEGCQQEPADGEGYVASVYRESLYRESGYRNSLYRNSAYRPQICVGEDCTDSISVPSVSVPSVSIDSASYPSASLESYTLEGTDAEVIDDEDQTAYLAPADVLFEFDESELSADAVPTLQAIVGAIEADFTDGAVTSVEGHTDDQGGEDYNQTLSEDRAAAVATWLTEEGGIDAGSVSTTGYGETRPVAPNQNEDGSDNPGGRAQNRRVVITVTPA